MAELFWCFCLLSTWSRVAVNLRRFFWPPPDPSTQVTHTDSGRHTPFQGAGWPSINHETNKPEHHWKHNIYTIYTHELCSGQCCGGCPRLRPGLLKHCMIMHRSRNREDNNKFDQRSLPFQEAQESHPSAVGWDHWQTDSEMPWIPEMVGQIKIELQPVSEPFVGCINQIKMFTRWLWCTQTERMRWSLKTTIATEWVNYFGRITTCAAHVSTNITAVRLFLVVKCIKMLVVGGRRLDGETERLS